MNVDTPTALEAALGGAVAPLVGSEQAHHNTHYRGVLADGDVLVKVIDDQPAYYTAEVRAACHLASPDIRTPRLLRHGILDDGRGWLAYEWHDLRPFTPSPPQVEHAGQLLGSLHAATRSLVDATLRDYPTLHELISGKIAQVAQFDTALADRIRHLHHTLTNPASTELDSSRVCLLHGDMGWRNIHLDAHDDTWLIDFEHAAIGHPLLDFAKLWDRELDDPTTRALFLRGYHQHQPTDTMQPNQIDTVRLWAAAGIVPYARPRGDHDFEQHAMRILDRLETRS